MEELQAKRLLLVVKNTRGEYLIPDGQTLAKWFSSKGHRIGERAARRVIERLEAHGCIRREGPKRFVDDTQLATELPACIYLLQFRELCLKKPDRRSTSKTALHRHLMQKFRKKFPQPGTLERIYTHALGAHYIREVDTVPGKLLMGSALDDHLPYLELLLKDGR